MRNIWPLPETPAPPIQTLHIITLRSGLLQEVFKDLERGSTYALRPADNVALCCPAYFQWLPDRAAPLLAASVPCAQIILVSPGGSYRIIVPNWLNISTNIRNWLVQACVRSCDARQGKPSTEFCSPLH